MTNLDAQLPAGVEATDVDPWEPAGVDYPEYRMFWSKSLHAKLWVRVVGVQYADGSVAATGSDAPLVYIEHNEFTPRAVRDLAAALLAAADLAEEWAGSSRCITAPEDVSAAGHVDDEQASVVVNLPAPECYLHPDAATELGYQMVDAARQADRAAGVKR